MGFFFESKKSARHKKNGARHKKMVPGKNMKKTILIVEDRMSLREMLRDFFSSENYEVFTASSGSEGIDEISKNSVDCVLLDLKLPDMSGIDVLKSIKTFNPMLPVIIMTAYGTIPETVKAIKSGADDFIQKPLNLELLKHQVEKVSQFYKLKTKVLLYEKDFVEEKSLPLIIAKSEAMKEIAFKIQKIALSDITVLLTGESGTGKELFAKAIHQLSNRKDKRFVEVNCAAIPHSLVENELFGHERGAYTGAYTSEIGKLELASGGTIFLDEVSEIPLSVQPKLLKVVEEKKIMRIGGIKEIPVDIRIIAATNRDLESEVEKGNFREDLYYRISGVTIRIPPLRDRREDIIPIVKYYVEYFSRIEGKEIKKIDKDLERKLYEYNWPGNVRELKNAVYSGVIFDSDGILSEEDIKIFTKNEPFSITFDENKIIKVGLKKYVTLLKEKSEMEIIRFFMKKYGDKKKVANLLKISYRSLLDKLKSIK